MRRRQQCGQSVGEALPGRDAVFHGAGHFNPPHQGKGARGIPAPLEVAEVISRLECSGNARKRDAHAEKKATASPHRLGCAAT